MLTIACQSLVVRVLRQLKAMPRLERADHVVSRFDSFHVQSAHPGAFDLRWFGPLVRRLHDDQMPLSTLALGSSLTGVHGGCTEAAPILTSGDGSTCKCPLCCGSRCGSWSDHGWARTAHDWLHFRHPHKDSKCINLGEPGGTLIPAIVACPLTYLNMDGPHLVLIDAVTSSLKDLEHLLRHLLNRRALPVLVQFFRFFTQGGSCQTRGKGRAAKSVWSDTTVTSLSWLQREISRLHRKPPQPLPSLLRDFFTDDFNETMAALEADIGPDERVRSGFGAPPRIVRILREVSATWRMAWHSNLQPAPLALLQPWCPSADE